MKTKRWKQKAKELYLSGKSFTQIAKELNKPVGTIKTLSHREKWGKNETVNETAVNKAHKKNKSDNYNKNETSKNRFQKVSSDENKKVLTDKENVQIDNTLPLVKNETATTLSQLKQSVYNRLKYLIDNPKKNGDLEFYRITIGFKAFFNEMKTDVDSNESSDGDLNQMELYIKMFENAKSNY